MTSICQRGSLADHPPGPELGRELEGVLTQLGSDRLCDRARVARRGEIEVGDLAPEGGVAHSAADDPDIVSVMQCPAAGDHDRRRGKLLERAHPGHPRHPRGDRTGDLVVDRLQAVRDLLGEDPLLALATDQNRLLARFDVGLRSEVDRDVVHRHSADERMAAAAYEDVGVVGEGAADAVAVAKRDHPDPGVHRRRPLAPVAGAGAGGEPLDVGDVRVQRERRPQALLGRVVLKGVEPVDGHPAPRHPVVGAFGAEDGGAVGSVDEDLGMLGFDRGGDLVETVELLVEVGRVEFVGGGEVGPDPGQLEVGVLGAGTRQLQHLARVAVAEPAHAAVVLDVDAGPVPVRSRSRSDHAAEILAPERQLRAGRDHAVDLLVSQRPHRQQRHVLEAPPDLLGLAGGGHRQPRRAPLQGRRGTAVGAVSVPVRLDHRAQLRPIAEL